MRKDQPQATRLSYLRAKVASGVDRTPVKYCGNGKLRPPTPL